MNDHRPPQNLEAEQAVLGSCLIEPAALDTACEVLKPEDFYGDAHQTIYAAMLALAERNTAVDGITLEAELRGQETLEAVGGRLYLLNLMQAPTTAANIRYYAELVERAARRRELIDAASRIYTLANDSLTEVEEAVDTAQQLVYGITERRQQRGFAALRGLLDDELDRIEARYENAQTVTGRGTGIEDLDYMTAGLQPSDLIVLAARPSMGKSALALQLGLQVALEEKRPVAVFSLEMAREQLATRLVCSEARIDAHRVRTGYMGPNDWQALGCAVSRMADAPLFIDDTPALTPTDMRAKCRRLKAEQGGLGLVVIDYLQMMRAPRKSENRQQEITEIAEGCKTLARELEVPVLALAQVGRSVEARPNKRPMLSDLRESGSIEAAADLVMFLYRDAYYSRNCEDENEAQTRGFEEAEIIIAKQRNGPTGTVTVGFTPRYARFAPIDPHHTEPPNEATDPMPTRRYDLEE